MSEIRVVDEHIRLIPYYPNSEVTLKWYQDKQLCRQVDNIDTVYTLEKLERMYSFLNENGDLYYIEYDGILCGDICLRNNEEVCIVISPDYQNRHIGRKCIRNILLLAKEKGYKKVLANVYKFNKQSYAMFRAAGFMDYKEEWLVYYVPGDIRRLHKIPKADIDMMVLDRYEENMK